MCFSIQVDKDLKKLSKTFGAKINATEFKKLQGTINALPELSMKIPGDDGRIYPNYFAPVIRMIDNERVIYPMRYRVRPKGSSEEIPNKFNVFNARMDSLHSRATWKKLIGRNHGLIPFKRFYEWVPGPNKRPKLISFFAKDEEIMWSPCLYDYWEDPNKKVGFFSFAIITTEPPKEVLEMGHDRCPIMIKENDINEWLSGKFKLDVNKFTNNEMNFEHEFVS